MNGEPGSDDEEEPGRWVFPHRVVPAGQYLVAFASGKDRRAPTGTNRLHTNFKLSGDGEFLGHVVEVQAVRGVGVSVL